MFCTKCGGELEEGRAFCKHCGHPVTEPSSSESPPPITEPITEPAIDPDATIVRPPGPPMPMPPPPPVGTSAWKPPPPAPPQRARGGLMIGIIAAVIIVLAGAGVGTHFAFFHGTDEGPVAEETAQDIVTTTTTDTLAETEDTGATHSTTLMTIPVLDLDAATLEDVATGEAAFRAAVYDLVTLLQQADMRVPELATQINNTAPKVPAGVSDELADMRLALETTHLALMATEAPDGHSEAFDSLIQAYDHMHKRIASTLDGVAAMRNAGKVDAAKTYFDQGRLSRDAYRQAMEEYYDASYIE